MGIHGKLAHALGGDQACCDNDADLFSGIDATVGLLDVGDLERASAADGRAARVADLADKPDGVGDFTCIRLPPRLAATAR